MSTPHPTAPGAGGKGFRHLGRYALLLLVVAVLVQAVLFRWVARSDNPSPWLTRTTVAVSLAAWFAVSMAGRAIGFV